jgi:hypothetical protein
MGFVIDPAGMRAESKAVDGARTAAADDLRRLSDRTRAGGPAAWGHLPGQDLYDQLTALAADAVALVDGVLAHSAGGTQAMAADYERADHAARDDLTRAAARSS